MPCTYIQIHVDKAEIHFCSQKESSCLCVFLCVFSSAFPWSISKKYHFNRLHPLMNMFKRVTFKKLLILFLGNELLVNQWMAPTSIKGMLKMSNPQTSGFIMRDWSWNQLINLQTQTPSWLILQFLVTLKISHQLTIPWTATSIKGGIRIEVQVFPKCWETIFT